MSCSGCSALHGVNPNLKKKKKIRKPFSRPVVRFSVSDRFNRYVSMDLNEVEKGMVWILHLIDAAARYADACLVRRKKKS